MLAWTEGALFEPYTHIGRVNMSTAAKRRLSDDSSAAVTALEPVGESRLAKRSRVVDIVPVDQQVVTLKTLQGRTSGLAAPTMLLTGHGAAVYSLKFDPSGQHVASSSFDRSICTCAL